MKNVWSKLVVLFLIISLGLNVITVLRFNNITEDINRNFIKLNYLERNISELSSDLNKVGSKQDWVTNKDYEILQIDKDYKNVTIMVHGTLKELENNSDVYLLYGKVSNKTDKEIEWNRVPLTISYGLKFAKKIELSYKENYIFKILAEGQSKSKSEELLYVFFKDDIENRIYTHMFSSESSKNNVDLNINIKNNYKGQEKFKIKNVDINIYTNNTLSKTVPIYKNGSLVKSNSIIEIPIYDRNNNLATTDDGGIEKLSYNVNIKRDFKEDSNTKLELVIEDYIGEEFKEEYSDVR